MRRDTGQPIGLVAAVDQDLRSGTAEMGLFVDAGLWQAGWPLEGAILFLDHLFTGIGFRKVYISVLSSVLGRLGGVERFFDAEACLRAHARVDGGYEDLHILSMDRSQWDSDHARWITGNARPGRGG